MGLDTSESESESGVEGFRRLVKDDVFSFKDVTDLNQADTSGSEAREYRTYRGNFPIEQSWQNWTAYKTSSADNGIFESSCCSWSGRI